MIVLGLASQAAEPATVGGDEKVVHDEVGECN